MFYRSITSPYGVGTFPLSKIHGGHWPQEASKPTLSNLLFSPPPHSPNLQDPEDFWASRCPSHLGGLGGHLQARPSSAGQGHSALAFLGVPQGEDLLVRSSELIYLGELTRVTQPQAKSQQRMFFLFDHQLIYCKKDLLRRDMLYYKGRLDMDGSEVVDLEDGKDRDLHMNIKNAFRVHCSTSGDSHLLCARKPEQKQRWLKAFAREREQVRLDQETGFSITELQRKQAMLNASKQAAGKPKAVGRPCRLTRHKHPTLPISRPQQQVLVQAETRRKPSTFWHSMSRLAPFRK